MLSILFRLFVIFLVSFLFISFAIFSWYYIGDDPFLLDLILQKANYDFYALISLLFIVVVKNFIFIFFASFLFSIIFVFNSHISFVYGIFYSLKIIFVYFLFFVTIFFLLFFYFENFFAYKKEINFPATNLNNYMLVNSDYLFFYPGYYDRKFDFLLLLPKSNYSKKIMVALDVYVLDNRFIFNRVFYFDENKLGFSYDDFAYKDVFGISLPTFFADVNMYFSITQNYLTFIFNSIIKSYYFDLFRNYILGFNLAFYNFIYEYSYFNFVLFFKNLFEIIFLTFLTFFISLLIYVRSLSFWNYLNSIVVFFALLFSIDYFVWFFQYFFDRGIFEYYDIDWRLFLFLFFVVISFFVLTFLKFLLFRKKISYNKFI